MRPITGYHFLALLYGMCTLILLIPTACSTVGSLAGQAGVRVPEVEFTEVRLRKLSFDRADLELDLRINNPNPLSIRLAGFSYDLFIDQQPFLKGREDREVTLAANAESTIPLPLTISFDHLYAAFRELRQKDAAEYLLQCALFFDLPILGRVEIPASKTGALPLPKIPAMNIQSLSLQRLSLSGADLVLRVQMENPNAFTMALEGMQYQLFVDDQAWASGETGNRISLAERGNGLVEIPISLDLLRMGTSIRSLVTGSKPLSIRLLGDLDMSTSMPPLDRTHLPFDLQGSTAVLQP